MPYGGCVVRRRRPLSPIAASLWLSALGASAIGRPALAESQGLPTVVVTGSCPTRSAIDGVLSTMSPADASYSPPHKTDGPAVEDLGPRYRVAVGEHGKIYADPARDCVERARVAAAFIALALDLVPANSNTTGRASGAGTAASGRAVVPTDSHPQVAPPEPPRASAWDGYGPDAPSGGSPPRTHLRWQVDVRSAVQVDVDDSLITPGVVVGITGRYGLLAGRAACGWYPGVPLQLAGRDSTVVLERVPCSLGVAVKLGTLPSMENDIEAGISIGTIQASGQGFAVETSPSTRFEVGARLALGSTIVLDPESRLPAVVLGVEASAFPQRYDLQVDRNGVLSEVGQTPTLWIGATAGLVWPAN
jgi:hypothetical protein